MRVLGHLILICIIFICARAEPPTWVGCKMVSDKLSGVIWEQYDCLIGEDEKHYDYSVAFALIRENQKYIGKVMEYNTEAAEKRAKREKKVLSALEDNPNIIKMINQKTGSEKNPSTGKSVDLNFVLLEYGTYGTLYDFYNNQFYNRKFDDPRFVMQIGLDIAKGLLALSKKNWVHTNVTFDTVVVTNGFVAKLINFDNIAEIGERASNRGSPYFADPRLINKEISTFDSEVDIYSLGVILFYLWNGKFAFDAKTQKELFLRIPQGALHFLKYPERTLAEVILGCMGRKGYSRPSLPDIIQKIQNYLSSDSDVFIQKVKFNTNEKADFGNVNVHSTVNRNAEGQRFNGGNRYGRRALGQAREESTDNWVYILPVIWALSALLAFLIFRALAKWVDSVIDRPSDVKAQIMPEGQPSAGLEVTARAT